MFSGKKVLITGAAGFIGFNLAHFLVKTGAEVHGLIRPSSRAWRLQLRASNWMVHEGNIFDEQKMLDLVQAVRPDFVVHCAAAGVLHQQQRLSDLYRNNVIGTINLLEAVQKIPFTRLIHMGGSSEYGSHDIPLSESLPVQPITDYGASKAAATIACQQVARSRQLPVTILRPFSVYGPAESGHRLIPTAILAALTNKPLQLTAQPAYRDFIFVEDVVEAVLQALAQTLPPGEIVNVASGKQYSNHDVIKMIGQLCQKEILVADEPFPPRPADTKFWVGDRRKAFNSWGWEPRFTLKSGLEKTVNWFRKNLSAYV
ncbi:MAG: NAD(P)-dependent oxidoreductase [Ardenticatenaceae bacterium]|nr:NAD(P)-dependent oxidoreductase [Ardenticatenaceae bacterium]